MGSKYYDKKKAHERYMRNRDSILAKMKAKRDSRTPEEKERDRIAQREYEAAYRELNRERYNATKRAYWRKRHPVVLAFLFLALFCQAQTVDQVAKELHRQQVPHAKIVLAQARLETGNFTSNRCKRDHNLFGIKHNGKYARYRAEVEQGIKTEEEQIITLLKQQLSGKDQLLADVQMKLDRLMNRGWWDRLRNNINL